MSFTDSQLRRLRASDRLDYHGVTWRIDDYSTYTDAEGYETEEWLLKSSLGKEYYLMREIDPNQADQVTWYLAEEVRQPIIYDGTHGTDVTLDLAEAMRSHQEPYSTLKMYNRTYQFESETAGTYTSEDEQQNRVTWDYWDAAHLWNLALEAWPDGHFIVYSTRTVQPEDFTAGNPRAGFGNVAASQPPPPWVAASSGQTASGLTSRQVETLIAASMVFIGIILMISGI